VLEYEHRYRIFGLVSLFTSVSPVILEQCLEICTTFPTRLIVHKICYIYLYYLIYLRLISRGSQYLRDYIASNDGLINEK
jgi:hypothetical protein